MSAETVHLQFLGKDFRIACPPEEKQSLLEAADRLNAKMEEVRNEGGIVGIEKIAIMAALNLAHDLTRECQQLQQEQNLIDSHLEEMNTRLDQVLNAQVE